MRRVVAVMTLFLTSGPSSAAPSGTAPPALGDSTLKGKKFQWTDPLSTQLDAARAQVHTVADAITIAAQAFPVTISDGKLRVATVPQGAPSTTVSSGATASLTWTDAGAKRAVVLRFVADGQGGWRYFAVQGFEYKIGGELLRLVDANADGKFDDFAIDGCTTYDSTVMLPLRKELVLGSNRVRIASIAADGSSVVASVEPIKIHPLELAALMRLNRWRSANGLCSVDLDPALSKNCSAHAAYLRLHDWSGNTNPHSQELGPEGATPEGNSAAGRSVICKGGVSVTLEGFLTTYYHRAPLMSPALERIGLNEKPEDITVIDVSEGLDKPWPVAEGWSCPSITPAPGARGVTLSAMSEQPHEPVSDLGSRGLPLMLLFDSKETGVKDFKGKLFERKGAKLTEVPSLVADPWDFPFMQGIVPVAKLKAKTRYHAEFSFTIGGKVQSKVIDFETE